MRRPAEDHWLRSLLQPVTYLGLGVIFLVVAALPYLVSKDREDAYKSAVQNGQNLTRLFEGYVTRTMHSADHTLMYLRRLYQRDTASFSLAAMAINAEVKNELTFQFTIMNADGYITDSSYSSAIVGAYRGDQEPFRAHVHSSTDELFISKPLRLISSGKWAIMLSRRLTSPEGTFAGVIAATIDPFELQKFSNTVDVGVDGYVSLLGFDGTIFSAGGVNKPDKQLLGRSIPNAGMFRRFRDTPVGSYWSHLQLRDTVKRLISYRVVEGLPMIAVVGLSEEHIFRHADEHARVYCGAAIVILALILAVIVWGAYRERILRQAHVLLEQMLEHMPQGVCMFGVDKRIRISNTRYATMYGLTPEQTKPGTTMLEIVKARIVAGSSPVDTDKYIKDRLEQAFLRLPGHIIDELRDGRVLSISRGTMPDGGSVAIHEDITAQRRAQEKITHLAHYDGLTDLANRVLFLEHVKAASSALQERGSGFAIHLLDLDRFKEVNDSLGHAIGDGLLKQVAHRLVSCVGRDAVVARLGGDEFTVLQILDGRDHDQVGALAARILKAIENPFVVDGHHLTIETSIGIATAPDHGTEADDLLKKADLALYRAKSEGRHGWRMFEAEMEREVRSRLGLAMDLRRGIANEEFEVHYQPVVSIQDEKPVGAEALIRWRNPQRGLVAPGEFIALAEDTGLIVPLGEWALRRACFDAASWPSEIKLAVNLSPVQLRAGNLLDLVTSALAESGLPPSRLEIEVTETVLLQNNEENLRMLHQLRDLGVSIALDDFGTGYSSMSYLLSFPFDKIKIDQKFVADLPRRNECAAIVCAVAGLARILNIAVTAEGVETREQLKLVRAAGCGLAQGYLFGRPTPTIEFQTNVAAAARQPLARQIAS